MRNERGERRDIRGGRWDFSSFISYLSSPRGFTLIELLIVLAIIGVLTSLLIANMLNVRLRGRDAQRKSDLRQIQAAIELYRADQSAYPPAPLPSCGGPIVNGGTTYIRKIPCDPTNNGKYVYTYTTTGVAYTLVACLENVKDKQKDTINNPTYCNGGSTNWSYTVTNP